MNKFIIPIKILIFLTLAISLNSCEALKYKPTKAGEVPINVKDRVKKNIEEGKGFRLMGGNKKGGTFDFASSNELWRASLDVIDFMPLTSVNYSGGIIITDWYSNEKKQNESIKITIRFLTNEIRSDALNIKIFSRKCTSNLVNCNFTEISGKLEKELKKEILKKAARYKEDKKKDKEKS